MNNPAIRALCVAIHQLRYAIDSRKGRDCTELRSSLAELKRLRAVAIMEK